MCTLQPNHGFGAYFFVTLATIKYCVDNDIEIYVDIRSDGYAESLGINCWNKVFHQSFGISQEEAGALETVYNFDLIGHPTGAYGTITPDTGYWNLHYVSGDVSNRLYWRDTNFLDGYREIVNNFVVVRDDVRGRADKFLKQYNGKTILGLHKRGRSHFINGHGNGQGIHTNISVVTDLVEKEIDRYDYLYITSDEPSTYQVFKAMYGDKVIYCDDKTQYSQHWDDLNRHELTGTQKEELLYNLMVEILILSQCDRRLLTSSNVSHMSLLFSEKNDFKFYDDAVYYY
jgi:hypothetical protein